MSDWLSAAGEIPNLTEEEKSWWRNQENSEGVAEIYEDCLRFTSVPENEQVDLLQLFLKRFRPHECVTITWACQSGPYYGGGACLISATEDKWNHTAN